MIWSRPLLFVIALLSLSACMPSPAGTSSFNPISTDGYSNYVKVQAGGSWFISDRYSPVYLGVSRSEIDSAVGSFVNRYKGDVLTADLSGFSLEGFEAPKDWQVELSAVRVVRTITDVKDGFIYWRDAVDVILRLTTPSNAQPSKVTARLRKVSTGNIISVSFMVDIGSSKS